MINVDINCTCTHPDYMHNGTGIYHVDDAHMYAIFTCKSYVYPKFDKNIVTASFVETSSKPALESKKKLK